jgi:predicted deacylase
LLYLLPALTQSLRNVQPTERILDSASPAPRMGLARLCVLAVLAAALVGMPLPGRAQAPTQVTDAEPSTPIGLKAKSRLKVLGVDVPPGTTKRANWTSGLALSGFSVPVPVTVMNGKGDGPVLCLTAAIHGDELNGIEVIRRVLDDIDVQELNGAIIAVPIVNLQGFYRGSRYLPDRRDLNRHFPGNAKGSSATRMAHSFFTEVVRHCSALVDLHTGSLDRTNLPQVRANLNSQLTMQLARSFGATVVLHTTGERGSLRRAAQEAGIPAVTFEMGEPMRVQPEQVEHGAKAIETLMYALGMTSQRRFWGDPESVYYRSRWVRVDQGGILFSDVALGERVSEGELLGTVTDPLSNKQYRVYAPVSGRILGMALNQVVLPGYAAYRIGIVGGKSKNKLDAVLEESDEEPEDEDISPEDERTRGE